MKRLPALLLASIVMPAHAEFLDCLFFDGLDGESASAPAEWRGNLAIHNCARRTAIPKPNPAMTPLRRSTGIAATAQAYADQCTWGHSGTSGLGENLYAYSEWGAHHTQAAAAWAEEQAYYHYASNTCSAPTPPGSCGHYTQMVWRNTTEVGCGIRNCSIGSPWGVTHPDWTIVVCNYSPPGNWVGQRPY